MRTQLRGVRSGGLYLTIAGYAPMVVGLVTAPLVARAVGPSGRGLIAAVLAWSAILSVGLSLGLNQAVAYFVANTPATTLAVLRAVRRVSFLMIGPLVVAAIAVNQTIVSASPFTVRMAAALAIIAVPLGVHTQALQAALMALGKLKLLSLSRAVPAVTSATALVVLAAAHRISVATYLAVVVVGGAAAFAVSASAVREAAPEAARKHPILPLAKVVPFGLKGFLGSAFLQVSSRLDQAMLIRYVSLAELGNYAMAAALMSVPLPLAQALAAPLYAELGRAPANRQYRLIARYAARAAASTTVLTCLVCVGSIYVVVPLLGTGFDQVVPLMVLLLPTAVALAVGLVGGAALVTLGRPAAVTVCEGAGAIVTIGCLPTFVGLLGVRGAAVVSSLAYSVTALAYVGAIVLGSRRAAR